MKAPRYPSLYQINTRVWLTELSRQQGHTATLDDIPDAELDRLAERGFDWIWFRGKPVCFCCVASRRCMPHKARQKQEERPAGEFCMFGTGNALRL